jgi:glucan phosphoethanolaminetransferase (alkaline phosphatase superfamily)
MMEETRANDVKLIWQRQRREHSMMSAEEVRVKAEAIQAKVRRNLVVAFVLGVLVLVFCTIAIAELNNIPRRLIAAAFIVLTCVIAYRAYDRLWSPPALSPSVALNACLEFYRAELKAQYRSIALVWRFLVPVVLFAFLTWNALFRTSPLAPRLALPAVLILILCGRRLAVRKFKQKLSALDEFEKEES